VAFDSATLLDAAARARLAESVDFGGGNVWRTALEHCRRPDATVVVADHPIRDVDDAERAEFSLADLVTLADAWSVWYLSAGVQPQDRVVVYFADSFENHVHLAALAQIGAIPVEINGRMDPAVAARLMRRVEPVGIYTDAEHKAAIAALADELPSSVRWTTTRDEIGVLRKGELPESARYRHAADDPVLICHSSGTTGDPKPVIWSHRQSVAGPRFRLSTFPEADDCRMLCAAPQSHSGAIAFTWYALLAGLPLISASDQTADGVTRAARTYRPTQILAFNQTFAELATRDLDPADFASVREWMNVGDSAHESHIAALTKVGYRIVDGQRVEGAAFGDGLGSSELGWAALRRLVTRDTPHRPRYLGTQVSIADVAVLHDDGTPCADGEVGLLGVRSESVCPGYWNDRDTYERSMLAGYWLSGDLVYRTLDGEYFHVDRKVDRIRTAEGDGYSQLMEEHLLLALPEVEDCAVVAGSRDGATVPVAMVRLRAGQADPAELIERANAALVAAGQPSLAALEIATADNDLPLGPTGKVLKRRLREKYADLGSYAATSDASDFTTASTPTTRRSAA
jgi:acyl-coenzyme A synthetase/AMP-(fatty) acid ligase